MPEELAQIYRQINILIAGQQELQVAVARIEERLPEQPCANLLMHLKEHQESAAAAAKRADRLWSVAVQWPTPAVLAALAAATWALVKSYLAGK